MTPQGKRMRQMSLLSGGEKAMTALAFVFAVFLAPVVARSRADAPGVDLDIVGSGADPFEGLESGAVDVAIGVDAPGAERFLRLVLLRERFVCLVRTDHPEVGEALDLDTFCRLPHALISPSGIATIMAMIAPM